jgi:hypothetical protein
MNMSKVERYDEAALAFQGQFLGAMKKYHPIGNQKNCRWDSDDVAAFDAAMNWDEETQARINSTQQYAMIVMRIDAGEAAFFARQLEFIEARTYDYKYPEYKVQRLIPVSTEAGPGAKTITFRSFNVVGQMKLISNNVRTLPRVDLWGTEDTSPIRSWGSSYGYTVQEVRSAMYANIPLEQRKANAARLAYEQLINKIGWLADGTDSWGGVTGLFYNTNVTHSASASQVPWVNSDGTPGGATPDQIIADVNAAINTIPVLTKDVEHANQVIMSIGMMAYIRTTPRSAINDTTIYTFLKNNHPECDFEEINEAAAVSPKPSTPSVSSSSANLLIAYAKDPDHQKLHIPQPFEQFPVQEVGLEFEVPCHARCGGVVEYYPLATNIVEVPVGNS